MRSQRRLSAPSSQLSLLATLTPIRKQSSSWALKFPCPRDQAPWSFVLQDGQQPAPVTCSIAVHQARDTVAEKGGPGDEDRGNDPATAPYAAAGLAPATQ